MKYLLLIGIVCLFFSSCDPAPPVKEIPFDQKFEHDWHMPADGSEAIAVTSTLIKNNIPAEDVYVRTSIENKDVYLVACKYDSIWRFYEIWTNSNDILSVSRKDIWHFPPEYISEPVIAKKKKRKHRSSNVTIIPGHAMGWYQTKTKTGEDTLEYIIK